MLSKVPGSTESPPSLAGDPSQTMPRKEGELKQQIQNTRMPGHETRIEQAEMRTEPAKSFSEQLIRASEITELRYRRLFEAAKDGILILETETGRISDVNPFLIEMLGYSHGELLGTAIWELGPFRDIVSNKAKFEELQQHGYVRYENLPLEARDGHKIAVEFVSNVYQAGDKKVIQCNIRDITERKRIEDQLKTSFK
jgi:PAS domain S-box-containing protein